jgi:hypothetical protein
VFQRLGLDAQTLPYLKAERNKPQQDYLAQFAAAYTSIE